MSTDLLEELIAAGTPARLVAKVAALAAQVEVLNQRRASDAARQQRNRQVSMSRDITLGHVTGVTERDVTGQERKVSKPSKERNSDYPKGGNPHTRARGLPPDWKLSEEGKTYARARGWAESKIEFEEGRFRDHALGKGRKAKDWLAAWRNWVTSPYQQEAKNGFTGGLPRPGSREDQRERTARAMRQLDDFANGHGEDDQAGSSSVGEADAGRFPFAEPS